MNRKVKYNKGFTHVGISTNMPSDMRTKTLERLASDRALRLEQLRQICKMNMEAFANMLSIRAGTVGRLTRGETCLSEKMAFFISSKAFIHGVVVDPQWLLNGIGQEPKKLEREKFDLKAYLTAIYEKDSNSATAKVSEGYTFSSNADSHAAQNHARYINAALRTDLFHNLSKNTWITHIKDDSFAPYTQGCYVGGHIAETEEQIRSCIGFDCIIMLSANDCPIVRSFSVIKNNSADKGHIYLYEGRSGVGTIASLTQPYRIAKVTYFTNELENVTQGLNLTMNIEDNDLDEEYFSKKSSDSIFVIK